MSPHKTEINCYYSDHPIYSNHSVYSDHSVPFDITPEMVTGKWYIDHMGMYIEIEKKPSFIQRLLNIDTKSYYNGNNIHFTKREYFDCKG